MPPPVAPAPAPPVIVLSPTGPSLSMVLLVPLVMVTVGGLLGGVAGALTLPLVYRDGGWLFHRRPSREVPAPAPVKHLGAAAALGVPHSVLLFGIGVGLDGRDVAGVSSPQWFEPLAANVLAVALLAVGMLLAGRLAARDRGRFTAIRPPSSLARRHLVAYMFALLAVVSAVVVALVENLVPGTDTVLLASLAVAAGAVAGVVVAAGTLPLASRGWGRLLGRPGADAGDPDRLRHLAAGGVLGVAYMELAVAAWLLVVTEALEAVLTAIHPTAPVLLSLAIAACLLGAGLLFVHPGLRDAGSGRDAGTAEDATPVSRLEGVFVTALSVLTALGVLALYVF